MNFDYKETKICKKCGRELPLENYAVNSASGYRRNVCKGCENESIREKRLQQKIINETETYLKDKTMKIQRKYKKPYHFQILYRSESGIDPIAKIVNDVEFKPDDWKPWHNKRTYEAVGYLGVSDIDNESVSYIKWKNMIQRCYNKKVHELKPYYMDKNVCIEWQNYQNFKIWFDAHYIPGTKVDLDKDLLCKESNMYSPETCACLTHYLNTVFEDRGIKGNIVQNENGTYSVSMSVLNKRIDLGVFDSEEEAQQGFIDGKIDYICDLAEKSKGKVPDYIYDAMINWEIEID